MWKISKISFLPQAKWGLQFKTPLPLMAFSLIIGFINKSRNLELIFSRFLEIFDFFRSPRNLHRNYQIFKNRLQIPAFRSEILAMKCGTELKAPLSEMVQITPYFATFYEYQKWKRDRPHSVQQMGHVTSKFWSRPEEERAPANKLLTLL